MLNALREPERWKLIELSVILFCQTNDPNKLTRLTIFFSNSQNFNRRNATAIIFHRVGTFVCLFFFWTIDTQDKYTWFIFARTKWGACEKHRRGRCERKCIIHGWNRVCFSFAPADKLFIHCCNSTCALRNRRSHFSAFCLTAGQTGQNCRERPFRMFYFISIIYYIYVCMYVKLWEYSNLFCWHSSTLPYATVYIEKKTLSEKI